MRCFVELPRYNIGAQLVQDHGAVSIPEPEDFEAIPPGQVCLCVLECAHFTAAIVVRTADELRDCKYDVLAARTWLLIPRSNVLPLINPIFASQLVCSPSEGPA